MTTINEKKYGAHDVGQLVSYNSESGTLCWSANHPTHSKRGKPIGSTSHGYITFRLLGGHAAGHRVAWLLHFGEWPSGHIDHVNGIRSDNRIANLRDVTPYANARNKPSILVGRMVGAVRDGDEWSAVILKYAQTVEVGRFSTSKEASEAAKHEQQKVKKPMRPRPQVRQLQRGGKKF
jgi:hypothetical protein